jgi:hypothetical protein
MASFELRRSDYGATLRDPTIPVGFVLRATGDDPVITVGVVPSNTNTQARLKHHGDGEARLKTNGGDAILKNSGDGKIRLRE